MCGAMLLVAAVTVGIDAGWQPLPDGGMEYIIQIEPHAVQSLQSGQEIVSDIPVSLGQIKSYRIRVGDAPLPHEDPPEPVAPAVTSPSPSEVSPDVGWPPPRPLDVPGESGATPERLAVYDEQDPSQAPAVDAGTADEGDSKPWLLFTLVVAGLFGTFGAMLYTSWIAWDYRRRYRELLEQVIEAGAGSVPVDAAPEPSAG